MTDIDHEPPAPDEGEDDSRLPDWWPLRDLWLHAEEWWFEDPHRLGAEVSRP